MRAVCFLWFGSGNLFKSSKQSGGFLYETTTCSTDQSFLTFPLVLLVSIGGRNKATLRVDVQPSPTSAYFVVSLCVCVWRGIFAL